MNNKYSYAEGGFLDDGAEVDPISGNEVPSGSLAEEVRDDVPAQLSEGEFVVPADVVRYIGLEKLMQMRDQAKSGLAQMEQEGQMGGSPAPEMQMQPEMSGGMEDIDIDAMIDGMEDSSVQSFDVGGFVKRDDGSWQYAGPTEADGFEGANYADLMGNNFGTVPTTDTMTYVNADGHKIYIPVIDGKPAYDAPEGYTLVASEDVPDDPTTDPEAELAAAYTPSTTDSPNRDFVQSGGRERQQIKVAVSEKVQRKRMSELDALAGADLSQEGIDAMYSSLTPQAKNIYNERFRDPNFLDSWMAEGKSSADLLITAQKTADRLNDERGVTETDDESTYSTEPTTMEDLAKAAKYMAAGLAFGPMGLIGAGMRDMTEAEKEEAARVLKNSLNFFSTSPNQNKDKGRGNQPTETQLTGPTFNQAHWVDRMGTLAGEGLSSSEIQKQLFREQQAIPALYGTDAYGRKLGVGAVSSYNNRTSTTLKDIQDEKDKKARTLAKMAADAAKKKKEDAIQEELARIEAEEAQKVKDDTAKQEAIDREGRKQSKAKADAIAKVAREEAVRKAAEDAATQKLLDDQNRRQQGQSTGNGGEGRGQRQRDAEAGKGFGQGNANKASKDKGQTDYGFFNYGGLATKKKPSVKKMRNDPTAGLASKKKAKQKAQAKKGALAAKRT